MLRSKSTDAQNEDKNSITLIWVTIIAVVSIAIYISMNYYLPISSYRLLQYIGTAMIFVGIIVRLFAVFSLGRFFTVDVTIRKDHRIKRDGLYKYLRHPSYAASLFSFIGMGLTFNNWLSLLLVTIPVLIVFIHRIKIEESMLIRHFGTEYIEYKKATKRLVPFIY
ncbi:MAG: isoprenylcysteine carboxylmethyltransferase family protein [Williamsia sp.]|nr:isoprenylcysteine carboxylmethyltransferase family protein [Williamsia sp.]